MELRVNYDKGTPKHQNEFEIVIEFMENDADGWQYERFYFHKDKLKDPEFKTELEDFLRCMFACIQKDSRGRGGFDTHRGLAKEYHKIPDWLRFSRESFCEYDEAIEDYFDVTEEEFDKLWQTDTNFNCPLPTYGFGDFFTSYHALDVFYYDSSGDKFSVDVII